MNGVEVKVSAINVRMCGRDHCLTLEEAQALLAGLQDALGVQTPLTGCIGLQYKSFNGVPCYSIV